MNRLFRIFPHIFSRNHSLISSPFPHGTHRTALEPAHVSNPKIPRNFFNTVRSRNGRNHAHEWTTIDASPVGQLMWVLPPRSSNLAVSNAKPLFYAPRSEYLVTRRPTVFDMYHETRKVDLFAGMVGEGQMMPIRRDPLSRVCTVYCTQVCVFR